MNAPHLPFPSSTRTFVFGNREVKLLIPEPAQVYQHFLQSSDKQPPFWSRLWPAAIGICQYLAANPGLVAGRQVMELAAGLGLPSLLAAQWARSVYSTDIDLNAVQYIQASATANQINNLQAGVLDWETLETLPAPEVLLLSDINYDPAVFEILLRGLKAVMVKGATLVLCTPQRLMAKPFIEQLLPWCVAQESLLVNHEGAETAVSAYVLKAS